MSRRLLMASAGAALMAGLCACGPNFEASANRLRAQTIAQDKENGELKQKVASRDSEIKGLQGQVDAQSPRVQTLPEERLAELFTVGRFEIQQATDVDQGSDGKRTLRVMMRTMTDDGMLIPATGQLTIEAFVLSPAPAAPVRLGNWTFTPAEMKKQWYNGLGLNHFAFDCPLTVDVPAGDLVVTATFQDALTGRRLTAELHKKILPPAP